MKITMQCAMNYNPGMHRILAYIVAWFPHYHLEVKYKKNVAEYLNTFHKP